MQVFKNTNVCALAWTPDHAIFKDALNYYLPIAQGNGLCVLQSDGMDGLKIRFAFFTVSLASKMPRVYNSDPLCKLNFDLILSL